MHEELESSKTTNPDPIRCKCEGLPSSLQYFLFFDWSAIHILLPREHHYKKKYLFPETYVCCSHWCIAYMDEIRIIVASRLSWHKSVATSILHHIFAPLLRVNASCWNAHVVSPLLWSMVNSKHTIRRRNVMSVPGSHGGAQLLTVMAVNACVTPRTSKQRTHSNI